MDHQVVKEPINLTWRLAQQLADQHCEDCSWYHSQWQYMRLIGMGKTLSGQSKWFSDQIQRWRDQSPLAVLISGCADYSAFAHTVAALGLENARKARIVAVDRCQTPLALNDYLAQSLGVTINNEKQDIMSFDSIEKFDLIFTSSFLGFFNPTERVSLFRKYMQLLKPGGELVFANRMKDEPEDVKMRFSEEATESSLQSALALNRQYAAADKLSDGEFEKRMREFMRHWGSYPLNSAENLKSLMEQAGCIDYTIEERMPELPQTKVSLVGYTFAERTPFLCVVVRKPR